MLLLLWLLFRLFRFSPMPQLFGLHGQAAEFGGALGALSVSLTRAEDRHARVRLERKERLQQTTVT